AKMITSVNLFSNDGKQISLAQNLNTTNCNLNTSSLLKGAYLISIIFADGTTTTKSFIKQ
ncbi:MAG TPA: T9SS type A sorting domain-containing protein, partial [Puia sp.]|nr:T9SS type A sorting domain-containing protein [Puia sp.]